MGHSMQISQEQFDELIEVFNSEVDLEIVPGDEFYGKDAPRISNLPHTLEQALASIHIIVEQKPQQVGKVYECTRDQADKLIREIFSDESRLYIDHEGVE